MTSMRFAITAVLGLVLPAFSAAVAVEKGDTDVIVIKARRVHTLTGAPIDGGTVVIRNGRIEAVGPAGQVAVPDGYRVLSFPEHWLVPGIVEAHNHSAAGGWGDLNDMVYLTNPGLDTRPIPRPDNPWVKRARTGGVTTTLVLPGSGTNLSGFGTIVNTGGKTPD